MDPYPSQNIKSKLRPYVAITIRPKQVEAQNYHIGEDNGLDIVIRLLRFFGNLPISRNRWRGYQFNWTTPGTIWSLVMATFFSLVWVIFIFHIALEISLIPSLHVRYANDLIEKGLKEDLKMNNGKLLGLLISMKISYIFVPIFQLLSLFWGWFNPEQLIHFVNTWPSIRDQFSLTFPIKQFKGPEFLNYEKSCRRFKLKLAIRTVLPITVSIPIFLSGTITGSDSSSITSAIFYCAVFVHFSFVELLEDAKVILMCQRVADSFYKIRISILNTVRWEVLTESKVESWRLLICCVRGQGKLISTYVKPSQLSFILNILMTGTFLIYNGLTAPWWSSMGARIFILDTGFCVMMLLRLFAKVDMAEKITEQEAAITRELIKIPMANYSSPVITQIKLIEDLIVQNRTKIRLGGYVVLTKKCCITILGQIITYLIVLMQFIPTT